MVEWNIIERNTSERPIGESRRVSDQGPWVLAVYKGQVHYGRCWYSGPYAGYFTWELIPTDLGWRKEDSRKIHERGEVLIRAWAKIPSLPEMPEKIKNFISKEDLKRKLKGESCSTCRFMKQSLFGEGLLCQDAIGKPGPIPFSETCECWEEKDSDD